MLFNSGIMALALAPVVYGLPASNLSDITWEMENIWSWGSPGGSGSGFDISAPTGYFKGAPSFDVNCWRNNGKPDDWKICTPRQNEASLGSVLFRRLPREQGTWLEDMWVSHQYTFGDFTFNITGYALVDWSKDLKGNKTMSVVLKQII